MQIAVYRDCGYGSIVIFCVKHEFSINDDGQGVTTADGATYLAMILLLDAPPIYPGLGATPGVH